MILLLIIIMIIIIIIIVIVIVLLLLLLIIIILKQPRSRFGHGAQTPWAVTFIPTPMPKTVCRTCSGRGVGMNHGMNVTARTHRSGDLPRVSDGSAAARRAIRNRTSCAALPRAREWSHDFRGIPETFHLVEQQKMFMCYLLLNPEPICFV